MALRRMFSKAVVSSARFMKMPVDSQNLYFHLGMAADDDGVVEAWSVLKTTGSAEDNLKVLASKGFIKVLNEDMVSYILDWNEHNLMRSDRLTPSTYRELLVQVIPDVQLAEVKQRADRPLRLGRPGDNHGTAEGRVGEDRLIGELEDELRVVKTYEEEERPKRKLKVTKEMQAVFDVFEDNPARKVWKLHEVQRESAATLFEEYGVDEVRNRYTVARAYRGSDMCPLINTPLDLLTKMPNMENFLKSLQS